MPKSQQSLFIRAACHLEWSLSNGQKSKELPLPPCRYGQNGKLPKELRTPQEDFGPHVGWAFIQTNPILPESPESPIHNLPDLDGDYHVHTVAKAASSHGEKAATDLWTHEL